MGACRDIESSRRNVELARSDTELPRGRTSRVAFGARAAPPASSMLAARLSAAIVRVRKSRERSELGCIPDWPGAPIQMQASAGAETDVDEAT